MYGLRMFFLMVLGWQCVEGMAVSSLAARKSRLPTNVEGALFVDASCIDCDTCRWMAPETFDRKQGKSYVHAQPMDDEEKLVNALRAAASCPTGSIRTEKDFVDKKKSAKHARDSFPFVVDAQKFPNVYHLGYHSEKSFGATPYLVAGDDVTVMIDSPRYNSKLANQIESRFGAPDALLLTHIDDVADHQKWKERFPDLTRVIHKADAHGAERWPYIETRDCELILEDDLGTWEILDNHCKVFHVPGHSDGHLAYQFDSATTGGDPVIFTGDHLAYSGRLGRLHGLSRFSKNPSQQADSIARLADEDFLHVLPGHGRRYSFESPEIRRTQLLQFSKDPSLV